MPVLYGVFMFMGVSALRNMQVSHTRSILLITIDNVRYVSFNKIFHRFLLFFMPQKHQPDYPYLRHVRITRVHLFTGIQLISLVGMFLVKSIKSIAIAFPILVDIDRDHHLNTMLCWFCHSSRF
jgi:hypothetical protein